MAERRENAQNQALWAFLAAVVRLQTRPFVGLALSPGFTPRPLLSVAQDGLLRPSAPPLSPGFTPRPLLSERSLRPTPYRSRTVAGVYGPAFVERWTDPGSPPFLTCWLSPGFTPRPLLSAGHARPAHDRLRDAVAGVYAPAFVERGVTRARPGGRRRLSPGFTPRPLLSAEIPKQNRERRRDPPVAGVYAPAFVERA